MNAYAFQARRPYKLNAKDVYIDYETSSISLHDLDYSICDRDLGPFPFRMIRHLRNKFGTDWRSVALFEEQMNNALQYGWNQKSTSKNRHLDDLKHFARNTELFNIHMSNASDVIRDVVNTIFRYRYHVRSLETSAREGGGKFNVNKFYPRGDPRRFEFTVYYGTLHEPFLTDLINFGLSLNREQRIVTDSLWYADLAIGVDAFIDGIPVDYTVSTDLKEKLELVDGTFAALVKPDTRFERPYSTLFRSQMLDTLFQTTQARKYEGIRELPDYVFESHRSLVMPAIWDIGRKTAREVRPYIRSPLTLEATDIVLRALLPQEEYEAYGII